MLTIRKWIIAGLSAAILSGCAGTAEKQTETAFFPPLPQQPKLQYLLSVTAEEDIGGKSSSGLKEWLIGARPATRQIARPQDIASYKGRIYVLDRTFKKVLFLDLEKKTLDYIRDEREGALGDPMGLWVTEDDVKYVADAGRKQILVYGKDNQFVRAYGEPGQFERPMDVAVHGDRLYVVDFAKMAVVTVDRESGKTVLTFGEMGSAEGKLNRPTHVTVDAQGNIYVNDSFNFRIQKFDPKGNYVKHFGYQGDTLGGFARPKGVAVDRDGHVYAVDAAFENAQIFDPESTDLLLFFGGFGPHQGSMYLPSGLHIDYDNVAYFNQFADKDFRVKHLVYVGNLLGNKKLNIYGFGEWIGASLPVIERTPVFTESGDAIKKPEADKK